MSLSKKLILIGHFGVGKTSLVQQFVHQKFSEQYITTIGVKIDKKQLVVDGTEITLLIWDIAGENEQQKVPASYRLGAHGALYVFDLTRPSSYESIDQELAFLKTQIPDIPIQILGNKKDLLTDSQIDEILPQIAAENIFLTSAKTGDHVEQAFENLAKAMIS